MPKRLKKDDADQINAEQRALQALELRKQRLNYRAIGEALGVSHETARQDVIRAHNALLERRVESADELRQIEFAEVCAIRDAAWEQFAEYAGRQDEKGEPIGAKGASLLEVARKASKDVRDMFGLDAPQRVETVTHEMSEEQAQRVLDEWEQSKP